MLIEDEPKSAASLAARLLESAPTPILAVDRDLRLASANPAAEQWLGDAASRLAGARLADVTAPFSPVAALAAKCVDSGLGVSEFGVRAEGRGYVLQADVHVFPIETEREGEARAAILLQPRSLGERRSAGAAARSIAGLAATLAHEVKNPLSGIRGAAQLLEAGAALEDKPLVDLICAETDRICALVDRMQAFADPRPKALEPVNVHEVLDRVRRLGALGSSGEVAFVERYDPSLPMIAGDHDALVQLFLNLVKNAAEAVAPRGGRIELATAYRRHRIAGARAELPIVIEVRDNGPGAPAELREHLFQPFVSSKSGGLGLGLALVAKIALDHGGVVQYQDLEPGACFRVRLPVWRGSTARAPLGRHQVERPEGEAA